VSGAPLVRGARQAVVRAPCPSACYRRRMRRLLPSGLLLLLGCSSTGFDVGLADTDADAASDVVDSTFADSPADTPEKNACGGTTPLPTTPGEACGACGKMVCDPSKESVHCEDSGKNVCGGCGTITLKLGDKCGACGRLVCKPDGSGLDCLDPGKNACGGCTALPGKVGDPCGGGTCGTGTLACATAETFTCSGAIGSNACGGCGTLVGTPGAACGSCGVYTCAGDKNSVACKEATPAPGTACGTCKSSTFACSALATTTCTKPDDAVSAADLDMAKTNAQLAPVIDHAHQLAVAYTARHSGRIQSVRVLLAKGRYQCPVSTGGTSGDTGVVLDVGTSAETGVSDIGPIGDVGLPCGSLDPACACKIDGGVCSCSGSTDGNVYAYLYKGVPGGTGTVIGTAFVPASSVASTPSALTFNFPATISAVAKGDPVYFLFLSTSTIDSFELSGLDPGPAGSDPDLALYGRSVFPSTGFFKHPTSAVPVTTVQMLGCF